MSRPESPSAYPSDSKLANNMMDAEGEEELFDDFVRKEKRSTQND